MPARENLSAAATTAWLVPTSSPGPCPRPGFPPIQGEICMSTPKPKPTTNDAGIPVASDGQSLTVGPDGPILLQDH
jgi:hypothetical protein